MSEPEKQSKFFLTEELLNAARGTLRPGAQPHAPILPPEIQSIEVWLNFFIGSTGRHMPCVDGGMYLEVKIRGDAPYETEIKHLIGRVMSGKEEAKTGALDVMDLMDNQMAALLPMEESDHHTVVKCKDALKKRLDNFSLGFRLSANGTRRWNNQHIQEEIAQLVIGVDPSIGQAVWGGDVENEVRLRHRHIASIYRCFSAEARKIIKDY